MCNCEIMMKFEYLPNEILILCFEYLNGLEIFYAFNRINSRLNNLTLNIPLHINFHNVNQIMLENFRRQLLLNSKINNQIYSIKLINERDYLRCSQLLCYSALNEFSNLQKIKSLFPFTLKYSSNETNDLSLYINFQPYKHLYFQFNDLHKFIFNIQKTYSIINLTLVELNFNDLHNIFKYFPMLKYLHVNCISSCDLNQSVIQAIHLKQMIIDELFDNFANLKIFLKQIPNLKSLKLSSTDCADCMIDAVEWDCFIKTYLSHLKVFQFKFECTFSDVLLKKCQLFQHYWNTEYIQNNQSLIIYTIPYPSSTFQLTSNHTKHCTTTETFVNVTNLTLYSEISMDNCSYYFPNITSLTLTCNRNNQSALMYDVIYLQKIINLSNLEVLKIDNGIDIENSNKLLDLIKQTPKLSSISMDVKNLQSCADIKKLCKYTTKMIETLHIFNGILSINRYEMFSNIKHLKCQIQNERDLAFLLKSLPKVSTMDILYQCKNNLQVKRSQFIQILRQFNVVFEIDDELNSNLQLDNEGEFYDHNIYIFVYVDKK